MTGRKQTAVAQATNSEWLFYDHPGTLIHSGCQGARETVYSTAALKGALEEPIDHPLSKQQAPLGRGKDVIFFCTMGRLMQAFKGIYYADRPVPMSQHTNH